MEHAIRYQAFEGNAVERILRAKSAPRTLEYVRNERARQELQDALPKITQRPLDEYSDLIKEIEDDGDSDEDKGASEDTET
jgi:hypothetical protein